MGERLQKAMGNNNENLLKQMHHRSVNEQAKIRA